MCLLPVRVPQAQPVTGPAEAPRQVRTISSPVAPATVSPASIPIGLGAFYSWLS
jgi:hypothetical protein